MVRRVLVVGLLAGVALLSACSKDEGTGTQGKDASASAADAAPAGPKNLDLAKAALVSAKAKYAKKEATEADCSPIRSLAADFAQDNSPDAVKTRREIEIFCEIDITLEGAVATLKKDNDKLQDAIKKKDKNAEQMYAATVKDGCTAVKRQLESLTATHLDGEPKVAPLKAEVDPICAPAPAKKK